MSDPREQITAIPGSKPNVELGRTASLLGLAVAYIATDGVVSGLVYKAVNHETLADQHRVDGQVGVLDAQSSVLRQEVGELNGA